MATQKGKKHASVGRPGAQRQRADAAQDGAITKLRHALGVSRKDFARMVGFSLRAVADWENGRALSASGLRRVQELARLHSELARLMKPEFIPQWLEAPNEELGGCTPMKVLERGELERIWTLIYYLKSGM